MKLVSDLKNLCVTSGSRDRTIVAGPFKHLRMQLSLKTQTQVYLGLWEREIYSWLRRLSLGITTAIDIGAARGEYTLYFLNKTTAGRVYAFEPDNAIIELFHHNLRLNQSLESDRLELSTKLLGSDSGEAQVTLDSLLPRLEWPCLIKMDVDGHEEDILKGARALNAKQGLRWLIETHSRELELACLRILSDEGFHTEIVPNAWWRAILPEQRVVEQNRWLVAWKGTL